MKRYLTTQEAIELLGVNAATLYSYVSRGLIRSEATGTTKRERQYVAEDVHKLVERKAQRRDPSRSARDALHWGTPILESVLTLIKDGALYYRGLDARHLAANHSFEEVATLLWTGTLDAATRFNAPSIDLLTVDEWASMPALSMLQRLQITLALAADRDLSAFDRRPEAVAATGARIIRLLTRAIAPTATGGTVAEQLASAWSTVAPTALDGALILCADHELNPSSFAARVVAAAHATPYAVVMAGLAALTGVRHGGQTRRVAALLRDVAASGDVTAVLRDWLQRGERLPGCGHLLYPDGDPRATFLLALLPHVDASGAELEQIQSVARELTRITGEAPNLDFGLAAFERVTHLPPDSAFALFALGRTAGWIAHAIEQYGSADLIRPRAVYTGNPPETGSV